MSNQFKRAISLVVEGAGKELDLSAMRITFTVRAADIESPNNAQIRIYNLSRDTQSRIRKEFVKVTLQAGYEDLLGTIFEGTIKQFRIGREPNGTDSYFDLLCADGDIPYNQSIANLSSPAGTTARERVTEIAKSMAEYTTKDPKVLMAETGGVLPRGKVLFGMARAKLRQETEAQEATWSIQQGQVIAVPKLGYLPNEAVVLNGQSGLVGRVEQTVDGMRARALINPKLQIAGLVKLDNQAINQTVQQSGTGSAPIPYDQWAGLQFLANVAADGLYRVYVLEYEGDTRGGPWFVDLTCLALDPTAKEVLDE